jgi:hypothetical protein
MSAPPGLLAKTTETRQVTTHSRVKTYTVAVDRVSMGRPRFSRRVVPW